jgi:GT2 family glycosyltransferase
MNDSLPAAERKSGNSLPAQRPRTCAIIVSFRGAVDSAACVRSLLASTVPVDIVVVDTTPLDPDLAPALSFATGTTLLRASENVGFGRGNNIGIRWAMEHLRSEFLFLLNNDAVVSSDSIGTLERAMEAQEEVGIMVPRIAYLDNPDVLWYGGGDIDWRRASAFTPGINKSAVAPGAMIERDVSFATGCALFLRRSVLSRLRGFDPRFFMYEEDVEFCLRAASQGIRIRYIPEVLILHRAQGSTRDPKAKPFDFWSFRNARLPFFCYHIIRNRLLNVALHARKTNLLLAVIFYPLFLIRRAGPFLLHGRFDAIAAMLRGVSSFPKALRLIYREDRPASVQTIGSDGASSGSV